MISVFLKYYSFAKSKARFFCRDEFLSEDITQNVFLKIHRNIKKNPDDFKTENHIKAYLTLSVRNEFINHIRRKPKAILLDIDQDVFKNSIPDNNIDDSETDEMTYAISKLKPKDKMCFLMHHQMDYKYEEIATIMEISLGGVKSCIHRAKVQLKENIIEFRKYSVGRL
jgi:RNA polymerase sigma-70 factor (ECF subfamily)